MLGYMFTPLVFDLVLLGVFLMQGEFLSMTFNPDKGSRLRTRAGPRFGGADGQSTPTSRISRTTHGIQKDPSAC